MQKVNRELLLQQLQAVQPGLSDKDVVEQSSCVVFKDGKITTFNDEIACSIKTDVKFTGAVPAKALIELLKKLPEETIEIEPTEGELLITG